MVGVKVLKKENKEDNKLTEKILKWIDESK